MESSLFRVRISYGSHICPPRENANRGQLMFQAGGYQFSSQNLHSWWRMEYWYQAKCEFFVQRRRYHVVEDTLHLQAIQPTGGIRCHEYLTGKTKKYPINIHLGFSLLYSQLLITSQINLFISVYTGDFFAQHNAILSCSELHQVSNTFETSAISRRQNRRWPTRVIWKLELPKIASSCATRKPPV